MKAVEKILREVLSEDKSILCRRDELAAALEKKVPDNLRRDFAAIKKAVSLNVGEKFFVGTEDKEATKEEVAEILKNSGMQAARIEFVINTFVEALDWDKPMIPVLVNNFGGTKDGVQNSKVNTIKAAPNEPEESEEPEEIEEQAAEAKPKPPINLAKRESRAVTPVAETFVEPVAEDARKDNFRQTRYQEPRRPLPQNHKDKIFTTEGRLNRWKYFVHGLKMLLLMIIGAALAQFIIGIPILIAAIVGGWMIAIRRMHDLNKSGWWLLISFIPYVDLVFSLYVIFAPGTRGPNRYGEDPLME